MIYQIDRPFDLLPGRKTYGIFPAYRPLKDGIVDWFKQDMEGIDLVSLKTGERFCISFHQKQDGPGWLEPIVIVSIHYNCVGGKGSHYIIEEIIQSDFTNIKPPQQPVNTYLKQECKCL